VRNGGLDEDPAVELTVTLPQTYAGHKTMRTVAHETLNRYRTRGYTSRFKQYAADPVPSRLVVLTNYMADSMVKSACGTVGSVFTLPANDDPSPEITTAYPKGFQNNVNDIHEKFVYKMTIDDREILWVFFCSHNLTPASWRVGVPGGHAERKGGDTDSDSDSDTNTVNPQEGKNLEVGLFAFPPARGEKPWTNAVEDKLQKYYSRDKLNKVTSTNHRCQTAQRPADAEADAPAFPMDRDAPRKFVSPPVLVECHSLAGDAWSRYKDRKSCLLQNLLVNVGGVTDLLTNPQFREDNFTRYALYDYIFHDIAGGLTWVKGGAYQKKQLLGTFVKQTRAAPWYTQSRSPDLVVSTLAEVFLTWGVAFEMFHKEINIDRPRVGRETLIDYARIYSANVPDPDATHPAMFVDPKRIRSMLDKKPSSSRVDTYDSLSFLMHNLFTEREVWWTCPAQGHDFYWSVSKMFETPHCPVCQSSPAVQSIYSTVRALGYNNVTVELPVFKRESVGQQERLTKFYNGKNQAFLSIHGVLDASRVNINDQSALCKDVLVKGGLLQNMAYDVFFVLETRDGYQYVAIEADDPSHRSLVKKGNDRVPQTNGPKARDIHNQDAVKNVVSWLMNVHVIRISTADNNFNATALIPGIVTESVRWLKDRLCWCTTFEDLVSLHDHVKATVGSLDDQAKTLWRQENDNADPPTRNGDGKTRRAWGQKHADDIRNPVIDDGTKELRFEPNKPLSVLFDIQDKRINPSNNVQVYLDTNRLHAVYDDQKPVVLCNYVDYFSLFYNLLNMVRFRKSRLTDAAERFYQIDTETGVGTLFDSKELGGTHVVTRLSDAGEVCSVDLEYLHTWEMEEEIHPQRAWTSVRDGISFVRLLRNFQEPTPQQKNQFRAPEWTRRDNLDSFIKAGKKVWLLDSIGSKDGKPVTVKSIDVENGLFYLVTDSERIDPYYIRHRVYNVTAKGTRGRRRSGYLPIVNANLQAEVPRVPRQRTAPAPAAARVPTSRRREKDKLESWIKVGSQVTVQSEGGGAAQVHTVTRVAPDLDGEYWIYYTGGDGKVCAIAPVDIQRLVRGPDGERSNYVPRIVNPRSQTGCSSPLRSRKR
jgi:hypothetical protein